MKRLAELDALNPNIVKESQQVDECGMMPEMGMMPPTPSHPASINMTAGSGEELGDLLTTIMSLAGVAKFGADPMADGPQGEPGGLPSMGAPTGILEPANGSEMGPESPADSMRSVLDKLHPEDDDEVSNAQGDVDGDGDHDMNDHDKEKVDEFDNEPDPKTTGYGSMTPTGDDLASKGKEAPKVNGGGNPMQKTMEQIKKDLFAEYQSFVSES